MPAEVPAHVADLERARPRLMGLAYRMLGSATEAEDVVQDVALRYLGVDAGEIRAPEPYLVSMTTRACVDVIRSARRRRERYVGPWLPEPVATSRADADPSGELEQTDSISMAFLIVLQTLSPLERAAFLLHDIFDYDYAEVGDTLGRSEATCRQLVSRARAHLHGGRPRFAAPVPAQRRLTEGFLRAARDGDLEGLVRLLADDATLWVDGGGKVAAARKPVQGAERVARYMAGVFRKVPALDAHIAEINAAPAILLFVGGSLDSVFALDTEDGRIVGVYNQRNPDKLVRLGQSHGEAGR